MPCYHNLEAYLEVYIEGSGIAADSKGPLFRTIGRGTGQLTRTPLPRANAYAIFLSLQWNCFARANCQWPNWQWTLLGFH
jgi:hypothetical protein